MPPRDPAIAERTRRYRERIRGSLPAALLRAEASPEIEAASGALVAARGGAADDAVAALDALRREVRRWRTDAAEGDRR